MNGILLLDISFSLAEMWVAVSVLVLTLICIAIGVTRNRRSKKQMQLFEGLAEQNALKIAFTKPSDFTIFGEYRGYPVRIEPLNLTPLAKKAEWGLQVALPMTNPYLKMLRIAPSTQASPAWERIASVAQPMEVKPVLADWLRITTNDMLFSHRILSDDIKMDLVKVLKDTPEAMIYLEDEKLAALLPLYPLQKARLGQAQQLLEVLCNIKDELN